MAKTNEISNIKISISCRSAFPQYIHNTGLNIAQNSYISRYIQKNSMLFFTARCKDGRFYMEFLIWGCRVIAFFSPVSPKRHLPQNSVPFGMDSSAGDVFSLVVLPGFRAQKTPCCQFWKCSFSYAAFSPVFPSNLCILSCRKRWYLFMFRPIAYSMNSLYTFSVER